MKQKKESLDSPGPSQILWNINLGLFIVFLTLLTFYLDLLINSYDHSEGKCQEIPEFAEPTVVNWQPEKEFVTVVPVERIGETEIGRVIIKPIDDNVFFPVLVIPFREIPIETKVEIIELENLSDVPFRRSLIMVKPE